MGRRANAWFVALLIAGCSPPPGPDNPHPTSARDGAAPTVAVSHDPTSYQEYKWPDGWPAAFDDSGAEIHDARVAKREGDRQIVIADSASALLGHEGKLERSVLVFLARTAAGTPHKR
jgi:hypothetical protein